MTGRAAASTMSWVMLAITGLAAVFGYASARELSSDDRMLLHVYPPERAACRASSARLSLRLGDGAGWIDARQGSVGGAWGDGSAGVVAILGSQACRIGIVIAREDAAQMEMRLSAAHPLSPEEERQTHLAFRYAEPDDACSTVVISFILRGPDLILSVAEPTAQADRRSAAGDPAILTSTMIYFAVDAGRCRVAVLARPLD